MTKKWEDVCTLYGNITPFYVKDLSIGGLGIQTVMGTHSPCIPRDITETVFYESGG